MASLVSTVKKLRTGRVGKLVNLRLHEFESFKNKPNEEWFSELCFCILTANSKAETALQIQQTLGARGFCDACASDVKKCIRKAKHRFHNNKTRFIVGARAYLDIKEKIQAIVKERGEAEAREWLVKNIKGIGFKEASHFLRNVGFEGLAILDRHILNLMVENKLIDEKPKSLSKKTYLGIEKKFNALAKRAGMAPAELDLYMWYLKAGEVLK